MLTPARRNVMMAIYEAWLKTGIAPTERELATVLEISQPGVHKHLLSLERIGLITRSNVAGLRSYRSTRLTDAGWAASEALKESQVSNGGTSTN